MHNNFKKIIIAICFCWVGLQAQATTRNILFIGDSYIYMNNMPLMLQNLAASLGDTLIYDESDPGGYTFEEHSTYAPTIAKIFSRQWDIVILQEQSELPSFPPAQVAMQVYPYAHILDSMVHANDSCTQTMFMMTWGHVDGDPLNCPAYPVICTYDGMQQRLRESYLQMTQDNNAVVAPVGVAWKVVRDSFPSLWLYQSDSTHPLVSGSYLESCVLYSSIFHKKSYNASYIDGLATADAHTLQRIADKVVMDSLTQWQQYGHYPYAGFTHTTTGNTVAFSSLDPITSFGSWSFGDLSADTATDPSHTYSTGGTYPVKHMVANGCFTESSVDTVKLGALSVGNISVPDSFPVTVLPDGSGQVTFLAPAAGVFEWLDIYTVAGKRAYHIPFSTSRVTVQLEPGMYLYKAYRMEKNISTTGKFVH